MRFWWRPASCRATSPRHSRRIRRLGADTFEKLIDLRADAAGDVAEIVRDRLDRAGAGARVRCRAADQIDLGGGVHGSPRGDLDAAGDFLRGSALLGDGGGDGAADLADLADD